MIARGGVEGFFLLSLAMIIGHCLGDYPLQGSFLATCKNRNANGASEFIEGPAPRGLWIHALTAHSLIQSGIVWIITGSVILCIIELVLHWITDFIRSEKWIGFSMDQLIHVSCKIIYACLLIYHVV